MKDVDVGNLLGAVTRIVHNELRYRALAERVGFITGGVFDARSQALLDRVPDRGIYKPCDTRSVESLLDRLSGG